MNRNANLFHGTSIGWLMQDCFRVPSRPFGEGGDPLHKFIYICSDLAGAENAADKALSEATRRLKNGRLSNNDFFFKGVYYAPHKYVYEVEIHDSANEIDLHANGLDLPNTWRICKGLVALAWRNSRWTLWRLLLGYGKFRRHRLTLNCWIRESLEDACGLNGHDEQVVELLKEAGFDLVANIHTGSSNSYGVAYALIIHCDGAALRCVGTPLAARVVWP